MTYDLDEAREWFEVLPAAMGIEGLVLKPTAARYAGGRPARPVLADPLSLGDADGFGRYGVLEEQPGGLVCHECGRTFPSLGLLD